MTAAATVGMVEVPEQHSSRVVTNSQPVFAFASQTIGGEDVNPLRREKEEHGAHYSTYSTTQRTAARAGRI